VAITALGRRWAVAASIAVVVAALLFGGWRVLTRLERGVAPGPIRSLAVLPLENLSRDPEQEYFADGMTETLIGDLGRIRALRVTSRTSVMGYKGARKPLREIAAELGVDALLEGTVIREGERVRVTAQLIDGRTDHHL
jgi:TolB-like protein